MTAPVVFLDASCWVAAAGSEAGGSALIIRLALAGRVKLVATRLILLEAEKAIGTKLGKEALLRFYLALGNLDLELTAPPTPEEMSRWVGIVDARDLHVLAGAFNASADVLVSLDRKHLLTDVVKAGFPLTVMDTTEFLESFI